MKAWSGLDDVMARLSRMTAEASLAAKAAVVGDAAIVERAAKLNFEGSHAAGAPHVGGALPNIESGTLRRSIITEPVRGVGLAEWATRVGPSTVYSRRIELGYPGGPGVGHAHTRAFPYFRPAVESSRDRMAAYAVTVFGRIGRGDG